MQQCWEETFKHFTRGQGVLGAAQGPIPWPDSLPGHLCPQCFNLAPLVPQEHPNPHHEMAQGSQGGCLPQGAQDPHSGHAGTSAPLHVTVGGPCHARLAALCRSASQKPHSCELGRPPDLASSGSEWL